MISEEQTVLLTQRSDGEFLKLHRTQHTTDWEFVDEPERATRTVPYDKECLINPSPASHYFEDTYRAKEYWTKDCKMVPYQIKTVVVAKAVEGEAV